MNKRLVVAAVASVAALGISACGSSDESSTDTGGGGNVSGAVAIDGSSTVFPFAQAAAEGFQGENPDARVTVGQSGTGGGFEKFCAGEIDIADASRPIDEEEEVPVCKENGINYAQVQVANDGIAIVTNPDFKVGCMKVDQLNQLWKKGSTVSNYDQLGGGVPSGEVSLYGAGTDSGTFDFFTEEINGEKGDIRKDYQPSEDDNVLVQGVEGDTAGLAFFGFSYYEDNSDKLNLVAVDDGSGYRDDPGRLVQAALASDLHVRERRRAGRQAAGQGVHRLRARQCRRGGDHGEDRADDLRAGQQGPGGTDQGRGRGRSGRVRVAWQ